MAGTGSTITAGTAVQAGRTTPDVKMHPLLLRFDDPECERKFREAHDRASVPTVRLAGGLAIVLYAAFGVLDTQVAEAGLGGLIAMRAVVIVCLAMAVAATFHHAFPRIQQLVVCSAALVAGLGLASMQVIAEVPEAIPAMGTMLTLIFLFGFVRARFVPALITAGLLVAGYEIALLLSDRGTLAVVYLNFELLGFVVVGAVACHTLERLWRRNFLREAEIQRERARSDALLHNVLPETIAQRLRVDPGAIAEAADDVTVLFADIVGFTPLTERTDPQGLVAVLDRLFARFDELCDAYGAEKIKTIGDGYMAVAGAPDPHDDAAAAMAELAFGIRDAAAELRDRRTGPLAVRVGVCTGPVLAGVIGRRRFAYDLWGDTVNTASRLESHAPPGIIQVCQATRDRLADRYDLDGPYQVDLKGKGPVAAWHLVGRQRRDGERAEERVAART